LGFSIQKEESFLAVLLACSKYTVHTLLSTGPSARVWK